MNFFILLTLFTVTYSAIVPNSEHPAKLTARRQLIDLKLDPNEKTKEFWLDKGKNFVEQQLNLKKIEKNAKNVIFFIGDGMSLATIAAARAYQGGEEITLSFEKFPHTGLIKTYALNKIVPDSASTSTAYLSGVKANYGTIGVNGNIKRKDCNATLQNEHYTTSIGEWALDAKKSIGLVTTTRVTHASPAGLYAHTAERNWENNKEVKKNCNENYRHIKDIAEQLVHGDIGSQLTVILGGGRREFRDEKMEDELENKTTDKIEKNKRNDGKNLIKEWQTKGKKLNIKRKYVYDRKALHDVNVKETDQLLGLFNTGHMNYRMESEEYEPTLEEMTKKAIELLQEKGGNDGYFLFVEGGLIDVAHHGTYAQMAFNETLEFSNAVATARKMTSEDDTLIVVSSDHSHTMTIAGYPERHNNILADASLSDMDDLPFLTINYANGQDAERYINLKDNSRFNPLDIINTKDPRERFPATVPLSSETHGGEDVAVFASGPWSHLFTGVYEQSVLPHLIAFASCIGNGFKNCD